MVTKGKKLTDKNSHKNRVTNSLKIRFIKDSIGYCGAQIAVSVVCNCFCYIWGRGLSDLTKGTSTITGNKDPVMMWVHQQIGENPKISQVKVTELNSI